jgi:hypothetical protein
MRIQRLCVAGVVAIVLACATVSMSASGPIGGCPSGGPWELVVVADVFPDVDPTILAGIPSLDGNGDGLTCIRPAGQSITFRDNTVQSPQ